MLTEKHLLILGQLRQNGRSSLAKIGREIGLAGSTVFDHYQELLGEAIVRHTTLPDFARLGYPLHKKFLLKTGDRRQTLAWLKEHTAVNNLNRVDSHDAFFDAYFSDAAALEEFRERLQEELQVEELKEIDILEELKHEAFLPGKEGAPPKRFKT